MDEAELREVIKDEVGSSIKKELNDAKKRDHSGKAYMAFGLWISVVTLLSFMMSYWAMKRQLPADDVDGALYVMAPVALAFVIGAYMFYRVAFWRKFKKTAD